MRVAGSSLLYSRLSLEEACDRLSGLGFDAVDIGMQEGWAHVDPSAADADVGAARDRISDACESAGLDPIAVNASAGDVSLETEVERVEAIVHVAAAIGAEAVTLPAASTEEPLDEDLDRFRRLVDVATDWDVALTVETHLGTHTEDPTVAARYASEVPGLALTLDPGHYIVRANGESEPWADMLTNVEHVHLRPAGTGWEQIQQNVEDGRPDVEQFIRSLQDVGYDGIVTVEYIDALEGVDPCEAERQAETLLSALSDVL